jgi:hypothetical protein
MFTLPSWLASADLLLLLLSLLLLINLMRGICNYIPETNHISRV